MKKIIRIAILFALSLAAVAKADEPLRKFSKYDLSAQDSVKTDVIVFKGDARIDGYIDGSLSVYAGDIYLGKNGKVTGEIKAYAGKVFRDEQVDEASSYYLVNKLKSIVFRDPADSWEADSLNMKSKNLNISIGKQRYYNFFSRREVLPRSLASYTKAEGLYLGLGTDINIFNYEKIDLGMYASGGYAFRDKDWKFYLQEQLGFYKENLVVGAVQYRNTLTEDSWKIDPDLNYLAALLIHEDFYNYYGSHGYGFFSGSTLNFNESSIPVRVGWKAGYYHDKISEMNNATNYSLFGNGKDFTPAMELNREGNMKTVNGALFLGIGQKKSNELQLGANYETTVNSVEQDFRFEKAIGTMSGRVNLGEMIYLAENFRLESSSFDSKDANRAVPVFKMTTLGGTGTLPGYALNSIAGNKALISRTTLGFNEKHIEDVCFYLDMDDAWSFGGNDLFGGFDNISLDQLKKSIGIGLVLSKETVFSVHKRLGTGHNPYQMQLTSTMNVDEIFNFRKGKGKRLETGIVSTSSDDDDLIQVKGVKHRWEKGKKIKIKSGQSDFDAAMDDFNEAKEEFGKEMDDMEDVLNEVEDGENPDQPETDDETKDAK